jgi:hypothetical protein
MENEEITKCCECNEEIDTEVDYGWSHVQDAYLCTACRESDETSASVVQIVEGGSVTKYYIGDHIRMDEYGDDLYGTNLTIDRKWESSSEWRGYYQTTIQGWTEVLVGWTTGGWDDAIARRKQTFNHWVEGLLGGDLDCPVPVAIVSDPTSNVFSMGISVLTPQPNEFNDWLCIEAEELKVALA